MSTPRLSVTDLQGHRSIPLDKAVVVIGRGSTADVQVAGRDISRAHARIVVENGECRISDCGSRFGTFINGEAVVGERPLAHGDTVRLGQTDRVELVLLTADENRSMFHGSTASLRDLNHMSALLNGLRAVGSGRVLDEVLTLVLDSALDVTSAERGFVMLAAPSGELEFKIGREKGGRTLTGQSFDTSGKIPREVFQTRRSRLVADLLDSTLAHAHDGTIAMGIRHVLCVPLHVSAYSSSSAEQSEAPRAIGVLYLDSHDRGGILSNTARATLEAFATQAALAIDSARLYAESAEKTRIERDLRVAADIQQALLPASRHAGDGFALAAASFPCRMIGGDFFDYLDIEAGGFGVALGDVAGKGPPAALLAAAVQTNFAAHAVIAPTPADLMARLNRALLRRAIDARFATMCYAVLEPGGRLRYSNAGQEPPVVVRADGAIESLEAGGPVLGLLPEATYESAELQLASGDLLVIVSDGVTEARNGKGDEYGRDRLVDTLVAVRGREADVVLDALLRSINAFVGAAPQADDLTAVVLRYAGRS